MLHTFTVDATHGSRKPGIRIEYEGRSYLTIKAIGKSGLFEAWNQDHPERKICVFDQIVAVNGKTGDAVSMVDELVLTQLLTITLRSSDPVCGILSS